MPSPPKTTILPPSNREGKRLSWSMVFECTGEKEGALTVGLLRTISPPKATNECTPYIPERKELAMLDRQMLETNGPSDATEEGES